MKIKIQYHDGNAQDVEIDVEKDYQLDHILAKKGWINVTSIESGNKGKVNLDWVAIVVPLDE